MTDHGGSPYSAGADFDGLWAAVAADPADEAAHERFISFAVLGQRHMEAIRYYDQLSDPEIRDRYKKNIANRVALTALSSPTRGGVDKRRLRYGGLVVGLGATVAITLGASGNPIGLLGAALALYGVFEIKRAYSP